MKILKIVLIPTLLLTLVNTANAYWNEYYVPFAGASSIGAYQGPGANRYADQYMYWKDHNLGAYNYGDDVYEHEVIFYNYDGNAYSEEFYNSGWWSSTLPDPYLDTQNMDDPNEPNITIGTFDPTDIVAGYQWYNNFVALKPTNSASSMYKIQGQKLTSICELGPWCVLQSQDTTKLIPFQNGYTAPEYRTFRYEWENNDTKPVADRIEMGQWAAGVIPHTWDADFWIFNVPYGQTVDIKLEMSGIPSVNNYDLEIYSKATGNWVGGSYNSSNQDEIVTVYLPSGDYFAKIYREVNTPGYDDNATYHLIAE